MLGVAYERFARNEEPSSGGLTWVGLVGMQDPLRHGMTQMIADLHTAGIATVMITGDQMGTAAAIGRQLSLGGDKPLRVLDSRDLSRLDDDVREALVSKRRYSPGSALPTSWRSSSRCSARARSWR